MPDHGRAAPDASPPPRRNGVAAGLLYLVALAIAASLSAVLALLLLPLRVVAGLRRR
jgi:hypothetical protein